MSLYTNVCPSPDHNDLVYKTGGSISVLYPVRAAAAAATLDAVSHTNDDIINTVAVDCGSHVVTLSP